jgi:hypothetical protein
MLSGDHHSVDACWMLIDVFHRDLRFAVGAQERQRAALTHLRQALDDAMGEHDRHGH